MKMSKEQILADIKELEIHIEFIKTHSAKMYLGNPKASVLKKYNMQLWNLKKKLALI